MTATVVRKFFVPLLLALSMQGIAIESAFGTVDAWSCATKTMTVEATIENAVNGRKVLSTYRISAYACWDGVQAWAGISNQPSVTYVSGAGASSTSKGNYILSDGTADFWVDFGYLLQCSSFPFATGYLYWHPRIKVSKHGSPTFQAGSSSGLPCYYLWSRVVSHN